MIKKLNYYNLALWLAFAVALTELVLALYVASYNIEAAKTASIRVVVPLAILFGLWLQSNLARYLGAIWFVGAMASAVWPLVSNDKLVWRFAPVWALALSVLRLVLSGILLFSKQFADEFSRQRETQPKYKKVLIRLTVAVLIVLAIIATLERRLQFIPCFLMLIVLPN